MLLGVVTAFAAVAAGQPREPAGAGPEAAGEPRPPGPADGAGTESVEVGSDAERSAYQLHLDNGVRLYQDQDYRAAITEFEAAYRAEPKASPLVNIALSYKALHDYPKAIDALDRVIKHHADSLKPEYLAAAKREITEMRQLLAYATVHVEPAQAQLFVDGNPVTAEAARKPIALSPGPHQLEARLEGYHSAAQRIELVAGEHERNSRLVLAPDTGKVSVVLRDRDAWVQIDAGAPSRGGYEGMLSPGLHQVSVFKHGDSSRKTLSILVTAGKSHVVTQDDDGELVSDAAPPSPPPDEAAEDEGPRQGFYGLGHGVLLGLVGPHPDGFTLTSKAAGGAGLGARIGFRVADWAGFEGFGQLSDVRATGDLKPPKDDTTNPGFEFVGVEYALRSLRLGGGLRVLLPGRSWVRFVGVAGGGLLLEELSWSGGVKRVADTQEVGVKDVPPYEDTGGLGGFGQLELGVEFELSNVLLDALIQNTVQSTKALASGDLGLWGEKPLWLVGLSLHVGYGIW